MSDNNHAVVCNDENGGTKYVIALFSSIESCMTVYKMLKIRTSEEQCTYMN